MVRTVRELERAGAAAIQLEDQVSPKRCGHFEGTEVVSLEEMLVRIEAAKHARRDPDLVLIAPNQRALRKKYVRLDIQRREIGADHGHHHHDRFVADEWQPAHLRLLGEAIAVFGRECSADRLEIIAWIKSFRNRADVFA